MLFDLFLSVVLAALSVYAVWVLYKPGMLLGFVGDRLDKFRRIGAIIKAGKVRRITAWQYAPLPLRFMAWIAKPLGTCPYCMSSVYGFPFLLLYYPAPLSEFELVHSLLVLPILGLVSLFIHIENS